MITIRRNRRWATRVITETAILPVVGWWRPGWWWRGWPALGAWRGVVDPVVTQVEARVAAGVIARAGHRGSASRTAPPAPRPRRRVRTAPAAGRTRRSAPARLAIPARVARRPRPRPGAPAAPRRTRRRSRAPGRPAPPNRPARGSPATDGRRCARAPE